MKKLILFGTKLYVYLIEIPVVVLLLYAINYNNNADSLLKLYPLIVFSSLAIIFIALYFFNAVIISVEKVSQIGLFSSRDKAILNKDRAIVITYLPHNKLRIEVLAMQYKPALEWINEEDYAPTESSVFRERVIGKNGTAKRILSFFGATDEDIKSLISQDNTEIKTEEIDYSSTVYNDRKQIKIKFNKTL